VAAARSGGRPRSPGGDDLVRGLPPIVGDRVHTLILGSMPGIASLERREYYGHPRNAFWDATEAIGIPRALPYAERCARLTALGFALWDVLAECRREGSLDQAIRAPRVNDLAALAARHPELQRVWLNGRAAEHYLQRHVPPLPGVRRRVLPSTSPAHTRRDKLAPGRRALRSALRADASR